MRVAFRVDASPRIGYGHVMRCLTLAKELVSRGSEVLFVSADLSNALHDMVRFNSIPLHVLSADVSGDGTDWAIDAHETVGVLRQSSGPWDWIVVDHYGLDVRWETYVRHAAARVMVIDDQANRVHDCDLLLDQNLFPDQEGRYQNVVPRTCRQLLGPRYALMRPEFLHARLALGPKVQREGALRRVLVSFGGSDALELTQAAVEACRGVPGITVDVVLGRPNQQLEILLSKDASVHVQVSNMAALMSQADLSVGGGGVMSWERCVVGLPALVVSLAPNQIPICRALDLIGAAEYAGESEDIDMQVLRSSVYKLAASPARLAQMSATASALVDGLGSGRVADVIGSL